MKKNIILSLAIASIISGNVLAQAVDAVKPNTPAEASQSPSTTSPFLPEAVITEGFDGATTSTAGCALLPALTTAGWFARNTSLPLGASCWNVLAPVPKPAPQAGAGYIVSNFNVVATGSTADHSAWLVTPRVTFGAGASLSFWTRAGGTYADRLEVRVSTAADTGTPDVGTSAATVGTFTTLLLTVNSPLSATDSACPTTNFTTAGATFAGYPTSQWCRFTISGAALPVGTTGRIAFRNASPMGGPTGVNGNIIRLDSFSFDEGSVGSTITPATPAGAIVSNSAPTVTTAVTNLGFANASGVGVTGGPVSCVASNTSTGITIAVAPTSLTLAPGVSGSIQVTATGAPGTVYSTTITCTASSNLANQITVYNLSGTISPTTQLNTMSNWGLILMGLTFVGLGLVAVRRFS